MSEKAEQVEEELKLNKERGLYDASSLLSMKLILKTLNSIVNSLSKTIVWIRMKHFPLLRHLLPRILKRENSSIQTAAAYLENAFAFMESAFGESREMVIFITELNANKYCARSSETMDLQNMIATINRCSLMRNVRISSVISGLICRVFLINNVIAGASAAPFDADAVFADSYSF